MRIGIITSPFCELPPDAIGAVERLWANIACEFVKMGQTVQVVGKRGETVLTNEEGVVWDYVAGYGRTKSVFGDILLDLMYSIRALRKIQYSDVLVCNTFWTPVLAPLFFRKKYGKLVYNVQRFPKRHFALYRRVDLYECASSAVCTALVKAFPRCKPVARVTSNPINTAVFKEGRCKSAPQEHICVGYHGRVNEEKGLELLAKAVGDISRPDVCLRIIGPWDIAHGGSGEDYRRKLDELSGGRIEWMGAISAPEKLADALAGCSLYCYPSVAERGETFGVSPLEAMGLGLPVVVSALECFADFVEDGVNGLVFDHRDNDACATLRGKLRLLIDDKSLRTQLASRAAQTVKSFSTAMVAEKYLEDFKEIMAR